jgi:ABC-2 type transport system ATP-binding protein
MQEVEAICSRVIIVNKGKIVANDSVQSLQKTGQNMEEIFRELTR